MQIALDQFTEKVQKAIGYLMTTDERFIYRGEPERYPEVSSNLWRKYKGCHYHNDFDIKSLQKERVNAAKEHIPTLAKNPQTIPAHLVEDDLEMLTDIQHYGGETNLIDFTRDYLIALFFACDGSFDEDGRIIILYTANNAVKRCLKEPANPQNRIIAQKSVFIEPPKGFIDRNLSPTIRIVPKEDKHHILKGLQIFHNISAETIYNDLHGFITRQKNRQELCGVHDAFHRGLNHHFKADKKKKKKKKNKHYDKALMFYDQALEYDKKYAQAHNKKGLIHFNRDELDKAEQFFRNGITLSSHVQQPEKVMAESYRGLGLVEDSKGDIDGAIFHYDVAIEKYPDYQDAYINRSEAYFKKGNQENALKDWLEVQDLVHRPLVQSLRYYPDFEKQYSIKLPGRRRIRAFTIFGRRIFVKTWREMVEKACPWFIFGAIQHQPDVREKLLNHPRFSEQPENFRAGRHISQFNLYVETHGDSRTLQKFMTRLITDFGYHEDSLTFEIFVDEIIEECS